MCVAKHGKARPELAYSELSTCDKGREEPPGSPKVILTQIHLTAKFGFVIEEAVVMWQEEVAVAGLQRTMCLRVLATVFSVFLCLSYSEVLVAGS